MRKGIKNFCNGQGSTSTLDQRRAEAAAAAASASVARPSQTLPTLEEMIMRLEIEEARRSRLLEENDHDDEAAYFLAHRRRSCVDSSDRILRTAKDALNQYPRFSLDGKDAMCRDSFIPRRRSVHEGSDDMNIRRRRRRRRASCGGNEDSVFHQQPQTLAGEAVVWCKPGIVAKLMGLEALPVPLKRGKKLGRKIPISRGRSEEREMENEGCDDSESIFREGRNMKEGMLGLGSAIGPRYYVMKPISVQPHINGLESSSRPFL